MVGEWPDDDILGDDNLCWKKASPAAGEADADEGEKSGIDLRQPPLLRDPEVALDIVDVDWPEVDRGRPVSLSIEIWPLNRDTICLTKLSPTPVPGDKSSS